MAVLPKPQAQGSLPQGQAGAYATPVQIAQNPMGDTLNVINNMLGKIKQQNDDTAIEKAYNDLLTEKHNLTAGEGGYAHLKGEDAVNGNLQEEYNKRFDKSYARISEGLSNDQRLALQRRGLALKTQFNANVLAHYAKESENHRVNVHNQSLTNAVEEASSEPYNDTAIGTSALHVEGLARAEADRNGLDKDGQDLAAKDARARVHMGVIDSLITKEDARYAKDYIEREDVKKDFTTAQYNELKRKLDDFSALESAQFSFDQIRGKHGSDFGSMRDDARDIKDGKEREDVLSMIDRFEAREEKEKTNREDDYTEALRAKAINSKKGWDGLSSEEKQWLSIKKPSVAKAMQTPATRYTNPVTLIKSEGLSDNELRNLTESELYDQWYPGLDDGDFDGLLTRWRKARNGEKTGVNSATRKAQTTLINNATKGLDNKEILDSGYTSMGEAQNYISQRIAAKESRGEVVTPEDISSYRLEYTRPRPMVDYSGFDSVEMVSLSKMDRSNVPDEVYETIENDLKTQNNVDDIPEGMVISEYRTFLLRQQNSLDEIDSKVWDDINLYPPAEARQDIAQGLVQRGALPDDDYARQQTILAVYKKQQRELVSGRKYGD